jgi:hypothetical protein
LLNSQIRLRSAKMAAPDVPQKESEFEKLRVPIQEIIAFTNTLDEKYREKCFEVLLTFFLNNSGLKLPASSSTGKSEPQIVPIKTSNSLPIDIMAFLTQNAISEDSIAKLFYRAGNEVRPIYIIEEAKKATAQIQIALLTAFENGLTKPENIFEFSVEQVRARCNDQNKYDSNNFKLTFRNNATLFKDLADEEHIKLTPEGKKELAKIILAVSTQ